MSAQVTTATPPKPLDHRLPDVAQETAVMTVDLVIPALNEESCIGGLLHDVMTAKQDAWFQIQNIYVISDASTDRTDDIVREAAKRERRLKLIRKPERKGKQDSINLAFSVTSADVVVFIDADVRLAGEDSLAKLIRHFCDGGTALVQGGLVRPSPRLNLNPAKQAAYFDWIVVDKIRRKKPVSWWSIDGRVMALSRDFYRHLVLPLSLADDQFIFYSCVQKGLKFVLAEDAIFYYGPPESIADFSHQWSRYFYYTSKSRQQFGSGLIARHMSVPGLWRVILSNFARHPFCGLMWALCYGISKVEFILGIDFKKYERGLFWTKSNPTQLEAKKHAIVNRDDKLRLKARKEVWKDASPSCNCHATQASWRPYSNQAYSARGGYQGRHCPP